MRTSRSNRRWCTHYLGSNAIELCSSHGGISGSIGGKLPGQFKETVFEEVAGEPAGIGNKKPKPVKHWKVRG